MTSPQEKTTIKKLSLIRVGLTLSSVVMIKFYFLSKRYFLKHEELYDARGLFITKMK